MAEESVTVQFKLGGHEARLASLETDLGEIKGDVKAILAKLNEGKGSWKMLVMFGGALVGLVEIIEALKSLWMHKT